MGGRPEYVPSRCGSEVTGVAEARISGDATHLPVRCYLAFSKVPSELESRASAEEVEPSKPDARPAAGRGGISRGSRWSAPGHTPSAVPLSNKARYAHHSAWDAGCSRLALHLHRRVQCPDGMVGRMKGWMEEKMMGSRMLRAPKRDWPTECGND